MVAVAWDSGGLEVVESLCHELFAACPSAPGAVYLVGPSASSAVEAAGMSLEWLHPTRCLGALDGKAVTYLSDYLAAGRYAGQDGFAAKCRLAAWGPVGVVARHGSPPMGAGYQTRRRRRLPHPTRNPCKLWQRQSVSFEAACGHRGSFGQRLPLLFPCPAPCPVACVLLSLHAQRQACAILAPLRAGASPAATLRGVC